MHKSMHHKILSLEVKHFTFFFHCLLFDTSISDFKTLMATCFDIRFYQFTNFAYNFVNMLL